MGAPSGWRIIHTKRKERIGDVFRKQVPVTPERVAVFFRLVKYFDRMFNTTSDHYSRNLQPKKNPISQDYRVTGSVLGLGINGKVVECFSHKTGEKFALKVNRFSCSFITQILVVLSRVKTDRMVSVG